MGCLSPTPAYRQTLVISSGGSWLLGPMPSKLLPPPTKVASSEASMKWWRGSVVTCGNRFVPELALSLTVLGCENANPPGRLRIMP